MSTDSRAHGLLPLGLLAYLGSTGQVVLWAKDSKTILIISKGDRLFFEPDF